MSLIFSLTNWRAMVNMIITPTNIGIQNVFMHTYYSIIRGSTPKSFVTTMMLVDVLHFLHL